MPVAFLIIGIVFVIAAVRGKEQTDLLFKTLKSDFTGPNNFILWGVAIFIIGAVGYWKPAKPLSNSFMLLVVVVIFLSNGGFFNKFMEQIKATGDGGLGDVSNAFPLGSLNNPSAIESLLTGGPWSIFNK